MRDDGALWTSDGTEAGTSQVVDVLDDGGYWHVVAGGAIFFVGTTAAYGSELWKTDGTAGGTVLVRDIGADGYGVPAADLAAIGNSVYFIAYDEAHGYELWKSDGTEDGTGLVKDIWPGPLGSVLSIRGAGGGQVVFHAIDSTADSYGALWFSDGTEAGTHALALGGATEGSNPYAFTELAGYTYFFASDGVSGQNLFRTDGTTAGTIKLTNFDVEPTWGSYGGLTLYNSAVYFFDGPKMWKVDVAAPQGATLVTELGDPGSATPSGMIEFNGKLFFAHQDILHGQELWVSDGTAGGTHLFLDINPDQYASSSPQDFVVHNGALYFVAYTDTDGWEIYRTDGAAGATVRLTEFTGPNWLFPRYLTSAGGTLYFVFRDSESVGSELWKTDGTVGGSTRIIDPDANSQFNDISELTVMGGRLYFLADNDAHGTELWTSDGTTAGTHLVVDLRHGPATADIRELRAIDNDSALAFTARDGVYGREVWVSDGTALGTVLVDDVAPGAISSYPHGLVEGDGVLAFFAADDADGGRGIWSAPLPNGVFASPDADWFFDGPEGAQTLRILGGTVAIAPNIEQRHANLTIDVAGTGHAVLRGTQRLAGLNIGSGGRVSLPRGGETTLDLLDLDVDFNAGAKLDIADNDIVVRNADAHAIAAMIAASYHFGAWDLPGVMTSMPQAASDVGLTTVAVAAADATAYVFGIPFGAGGVSVDSGDVLIKYTYAGDVNLDGVIDGADYGTLDYWIQFPGTAGFWNGDVNYDGVIDGADYGTLDNSIQLQGPPL